jgi:dTDP-4-dehydrorhamnose 3,5-epimerase
MKLGDILVTPLRRVEAAGGDVLHALKLTDAGFVAFGEAYFSLITAGSVKAWKRHTRMTMNLVVPKGKVRFVFCETDADGPDKFRVEDIGEDFYARITVPPGVWFGFQGLANPQSLILNIANIAHDPDEVERLDLLDIHYVWE